MSNDVILDLCGGTGAWSKPYKDAGYDVELITFPTWDVTKVEFGSYAMQFIRQNVHYNDTMTILYEDVYGILAAPPCTEFSLAKGNLPRSFKTAMGVVDACLKIIWNCRYHKKLKFWALENPVGFLRQFMGKPAFTFEQWEYGEDKVKRTDIWGYFNTPKPIVTEKPEKLTTNLGKRSHSQDWSTPKPPPGYEFLNNLPYDQRRAAVRAITPAGFAEAFFKANKEGNGKDEHFDR